MFKGVYRLLVLVIAFGSTQLALGFEESDIHSKGKKVEKNSEVPKPPPVVAAKTETPAPPPKAKPKAPPSSSGIPRISLRARPPVKPYTLYPDVRMRVGLVMTQADFSGLFGFRFYQSQFMTLNGHVRYQARKDAPYEETHFGPEFLANFQLPNLTIVVPFTAFGGGYETWRLKTAEDATKDSGSVFVTGQLGLELNMTPGFGMAIAQTLRWYENPMPEVDADYLLKKKRVATKSQVEILFHYLI